MSETYHRPITEKVRLCEEVEATLLTLRDRVLNTLDLLRKPYVLRTVHDSTGVRKIELSRAWYGSSATEWCDNCLAWMCTLMHRINAVDKVLGGTLPLRRARFVDIYPAEQLWGFPWGADGEAFLSGSAHMVAVCTRIDLMQASTSQVKAACAEAQFDRARLHLAVLEADFIRAYRRTWVVTSAMHRLHAGAARVTHMCAQMCREGVQ